MSIATEITRIQTAKADLKTAIEAKGVTVSSEATLDAYPALVESIPTGGGLEPKTVNFIDPNGTLVASYTGAQAQALVDFPTPIDHSEDEIPLTFQEWNWTLEQIKSYNTSYPRAVIWVGACYTPIDGKSHAIVNIKQGDSRTISFYAETQSVKEINWGDGTVEQYSSSGQKEHTYNVEGRYKIDIKTGNGCYGITFTNIDMLEEYYDNSNVAFTEAITGCKNLTKLYIAAYNDGKWYDYNTNYFNLYALNCIILPRNKISSGTSYRTCKLNDLIHARYISTPVTAWVDSYMNCSSVKSLTISLINAYPASGIFNGCNLLKEIILPDEYIGYQNSFSSLSLSHVRLSASWNQQNENSNKFGGGSSTDQYTRIENLDIPTTGLTSLFISYVYLYIDKLIIPNNITKFALKYTKGVKEVQLPQTLSTFGSSESFSTNGDLLRINIPPLITEIPAYSFYGSSQLKYVDIQGNITSIGNSAFYSCPIDNLIIPDTITSIGTSAINSANNITIMATTPPTISNNSLKSNITKIYVPYSSDHSVLAAYQSATNWSNFASKMEELPE